MPSSRDYWSTDWVLGVPAFSKTMSRDRFLDIYYNIHLCDNFQMPQCGDQNFDKLFKVRKFLDDLNTNLWLNYNPHREQAVDEAMIKYKGRTSLKQYMPMKPIKRGIKMWCRADSKFTQIAIGTMSGLWPKPVCNILLLIISSALKIKPCDQETSSCWSLLDTICFKKLEKTLRNYSLVPYSVYIDLGDCMTCHVA